MLHIIISNPNSHLALGSMFWSARHQTTFLTPQSMQVMSGSSPTPCLFHPHALDSTTMVLILVGGHVVDGARGCGEIGNDLKGEIALLLGIGRVLDLLRCYGSNCKFPSTIVLQISCMDWVGSNVVVHVATGEGLGIFWTSTNTLK